MPKTMQNATYRLVLNAGSSSLKFKLFDGSSERVLLSGLAERIGEAQGKIVVSPEEGGAVQKEYTLTNHQEALEHLLALWKEVLNDPELGQKVQLVGHRVVHGGERFTQPVRIDTQVKQEIERLSVLAPLHNPPNLTGIQVAEEVFPQAVQVAVFDTAFHQSMPNFAYRYAIPQRFYTEHGIRVYGFHGTSHRYVARKAAAYLGPENAQKIITLHLGNGCSMAAVHQGKCVDTSMGLSPLAGLIMGSRSGDIDPSVYLFLEREGYSNQQIDKLLNKESGLIGIAGENDFRELSARVAEGDELAQLAVKMYAYRIKKYIGAYAAALNGIDALVFTAGVGENSALVRELVCADMETLGVKLDLQKNAEKGKQQLRELQQASSKVKILVVPTDEELEILSASTELLTS
jgi:acetate kinase